MAVENLEQKHTNQYLTNFARRYRSEDNVGDFIAPPFKVNRPSDKYLVYTKHEFRVYDNKIGRRTPVKEIDLKADEATYSCEEYGTAAFVYDRDLSNVDAPVRLKEEKIAHAKDSQIRSREYRILAVATSTALIPNGAPSNGAAGWANVTSGVPVGDILNAMINIDTETGYKANAIVMSYQVALTLIQTDEWKEYFKYTWGLKPSGDGLFDAIAGLRHLGLEPRISGARGLNTLEGCGSDPRWETMISDTVIIFHRENSPTMMSDCFMYSPYVTKDIVKQFYKDEERGWKYTITEDIDELLVDAYCGYLITNVV